MTWLDIKWWWVTKVKFANILRTLIMVVAHDKPDLLSSRTTNRAHMTLSNEDVVCELRKQLHMYDVISTRDCNLLRKQPRR